MKNLPDKNGGFTQVPNHIFDKIITSDFSKRQLKIISLICRLQFGFHRSKANVKKSDFRLCGVRGNAIKGELNKLNEWRVIERHDLVDSVWLNLDISSWRVPQIRNLDVELLSKLRSDLFSKQFIRIPDLGNLLSEQASILSAKLGAKIIKDI